MSNLRNVLMYKLECLPFGGDGNASIGAKALPIAEPLDPRKGISCDFASELEGALRIHSEIAVKSAHGGRFG